MVRQHVPEARVVHKINFSLVLFRFLILNCFEYGFGAPSMQMVQISSITVPERFRIMNPNKAIEVLAGQFQR